MIITNTKIVLFTLNFPYSSVSPCTYREIRKSTVHCTTLMPGELGSEGTGITVEKTRDSELSLSSEQEKLSITV